MIPVYCSITSGVLETLLLNMDNVLAGYLDGCWFAHGNNKNKSSWYARIIFIALPRCLVLILVYISIISMSSNG